MCLNFQALARQYYTGKTLLVRCLCLQTNYFQETKHVLNVDLLQSNKLNNPMQQAPLIINHTFKLRLAVQEDVLKAIDSLKPKLSAGYDEIWAKLTKTCKLEIVTPLTDLINKPLA